jgi:acetyl esterase/lipase
VDLEAPLPQGAHRGSLLLYGIYDLDDAWSLGSSVRTPIRSLLGGEPSAQPALAALASPLRHVCADAAPVFVCVGEKDALYAQSVRLIEELQRKQVTTRPLLLGRREHPDAGHSFINFGSREASQLALREALAFIRGQLGPAKAADRAPSQE